jgi:hypothetical protein
MASVNGTDTWVYKFAEKMRLDCFAYANGTTFGASASCADVAKGFGVNETDLVYWNPSLEASCTLDGALTYCTQYTPQNGTATMTEYCTIQDRALYNMRCEQFLAVWAMDAAQLDELNPGVGSKCENWKYGRLCTLNPGTATKLTILGRNYCVAAPNFRPAVFASNCNKFAIANNTDCMLPCELLLERG